MISGTGNPTAGGVTPTTGNIYIDNTTGAIYTVSGTTWIQQGADNLGDHTATQNLNLGVYSIVDQMGMTGNPGQILSRSATGTLWIDSVRVTSGMGSPTLTSPASPTAGDVYVDQSTGDVYTYTCSGTGTSTSSSTTCMWVRQTGNVTSGSGSPTTTTVSGTAGDTYVDQSTGDIYTYTCSGTMCEWELQQGDNIYTKDDSFTESRVATLVGSDTLTFDGTASNTVIFNTDIRVNEAIKDSDGDVGLPGQILSSTGAASNTVDWIYPGGGNLVSTTTNYTVTTENTVYVSPSGTVTVTLPDPTGMDGRTITIKRTSLESLTNTLQVITAAGIIDGVSVINMNVGLQGYTFEAFGGNWYIKTRF